MPVWFRKGAQELPWGQAHGSLDHCRDVDASLMRERVLCGISDARDSAPMKVPVAAARTVSATTVERKTPP